MMGQVKFLIIQTAFIGDVVLATVLADALKRKYPDAEIHFLLKKGNEALLENHPSVDRLFIWDKKNGKYRNLFRLIAELRKTRYTEIFNLQRFFSSGLITLLARAGRRSAFDKNPLSFLFSGKIAHRIPDMREGRPIHEAERNLLFLQAPGSEPPRPTLYPSEQDRQKVESIAETKAYFVIAPSSIWYTKQWPIEKWKELLMRLPLTHRVFLVGSAEERGKASLLEKIHPDTVNLCGELSMMQTVALMEKAEHVFTNDSAPLHFASAVNARHTAIFTSTVPEFGFGPLSEYGRIAQTNLDLKCRPCGLHGKRSCPRKHFKCATSISAVQVFNGKEYFDAVKGLVGRDELFAVAAYFMDKKEIISIEFSNETFLATAYAGLNELKPYAKSEELLLYIRDTRLLKFLVDEVPEELFHSRDELLGQELRIQFPNLKSPHSDAEERIKLPVVIPVEKNIQKLLGAGSGMMLVTRLKKDAENQKEAEPAFCLQIDDTWKELPFRELVFESE